MIQEILDYYFDNRVAASVAHFVTKSDLEKYSTPKLDRVVFDDYVRRQIAADNRDQFQFQTHERLHKLERVTHDYLLKEKYEQDISQMVHVYQFDKLQNKLLEF
jgi:hypothetical protein